MSYRQNIIYLFVALLLSILCVTCFFQFYTPKFFLTENYGIIRNAEDYTVSLNSPDAKQCVGSSTPDCPWSIEGIINGIGNKHGTNPHVALDILFSRRGGLRNKLDIDNVINYNNSLKNESLNNTGFTDTKAHVHYESDGQMTDSVVQAMYQANNNITAVAGTNQSDRIQVENRGVHKSNEQYEFTGGGGNDTFYDFFAYLNWIKIKDFGFYNNQDKLSLLKGGEGELANIFTVDNNTITGDYTVSQSNSGAGAVIIRKEMKIHLEGNQEYINSTLREFEDSDFENIEFR